MDFIAADELYFWGTFIKKKQKNKTFWRLNNTEVGVSTDVQQLVVPKCFYRSAGISPQMFYPLIHAKSHPQLLHRMHQSPQLCPLARTHNWQPRMMRNVAALYQSHLQTEASNVIKQKKKCLWQLESGVMATTASAVPAGISLSSVWKLYIVCRCESGGSLW